ncbi:MAG: hypothetical protein SXQ77_02735, partial [Halobacteria archaeon]|nr:hypothetical protein [Halobacteria archaeon]
APALAEADLGIAVGDSSALATDAADAVVTTGEIGAVKDVFDITRATKARVRQNFGWAFLYNLIAVPLAVVGVINPLFAAAMSASSLIVVVNSSRSLSQNEGTWDVEEDA